MSLTDSGAHTLGIYRQNVDEMEHEGPWQQDWSSRRKAEAEDNSLSAIVSASWIEYAAGFALSHLVQSIIDASNGIRAYSGLNCGAQST